MTTSTERILLVEDDPDRVLLTRHALADEDLDTELLVARTGSQALETLQATGPDRLPDLVLLDLKLETLSGFDVLERVRADPVLAPLPVVVLTSSLEDQDRERCYDLGANSYVVKPTDYDAFRDVIRRICTYWLEVNEPPIHGP